MKSPCYDNVQIIQTNMKTLSPRDLARSLGVSESSVKRWVDDSVLVAVRTAGGHRRIALFEAVRFVRRSGVPVVRPDLLLGSATGARVVPFEEAETRPAGERFFSLLEQDDARAARALLLALYVSGWPVAAICDGPMRLALEKIGTLWQHGPAGIVIEHRATDTCIRALAEMRALFTAPVAGAPVAVGAAPTGDPYIIPSMMAAAVLADLGYLDHNLGPGAPVAAISQAIGHYCPRIVWLAMSVTPGDDHLAGATRQWTSQLAKIGGTLVLGGRGAPVLPPRANVLRIGSMAELAAFARGAQPPN
jgi:MerR family transcriptional regulator, light-induced transcriptional regulator